jgi:hypothetical protein
MAADRTLMREMRHFRAQAQKNRSREGAVLQNGRVA